MKHNSKNNLLESIIEINDNLKSIDNQNYIFLSNVDENNINIYGNLNILDEMRYRDKYEHDLCLNYDFFFQDIRKSYSNIDEIKKQFKIDLNRCKVFIDDKNINDSDKIIYSLEKKYSNEIVLDILMLTTQALLGLPFQIIFNNIISDQYHLAEMDKNRQSYKILIDTNNTNLNFRAYKQFRIFKFSDEGIVNLYKINIKLDFNLNGDKYVLLNMKIENY